MGQGKAKINIDGEEMEVDFETLDKETAEKLGINIHEEIKEEVKSHIGFRKLKHKIMGITPFVVLIAFFMTGYFLEDAWNWNWTLFLLIPFISTLLNIKKIKFKKSLSSALCLLVIITYILTGILLKWWNWNWVMFFLLPIIWILCGD